eukprot:9529972-Heterocapsa_arctica.AAC.2
MTSAACTADGGQEGPGCPPPCADHGGGNLGEPDHVARCWLGGIGRVERAWAHVGIVLNGPKARRSSCSHGGVAALFHGGERLLPACQPGRVRGSLVPCTGLKPSGVEIGADVEG